MMGSGRCAVWGGDRWGGGGDEGLRGGGVATLRGSCGEGMRIGRGGAGTCTGRAWTIGGGGGLDTEGAIGAGDAARGGGDRGNEGRTGLGETGLGLGDLEKNC